MLFRSEKYLIYLKSLASSNSRNFPLYTNDIEIFDYRPGRYKTESKFNEGEWKKLIKLYSFLDSQDWCKIIAPSELLMTSKNYNSLNEIKLESPSHPIPVKKQNKYNIKRWAHTGRGDLEINSKCYQIYNSLINKKNNNLEDWKNLCYLWSSDFRTHITKKRWDSFNKRISTLLKNNSIPKPTKSIKKLKKIDLNEDKNLFYVVDEDYKIIFNKDKGFTINEMIFPKIGNEFVLGSFDHGYYDDISFGADFFSGHSIIERMGEHKIEIGRAHV